MNTINYYCPFCGSSTDYKIRDLGKLPKEVDCENCEGTAVIQEEEKKEATQGAKKGESIFIIPIGWEMIRHRKAQEHKYRKRGFSLIECEMLFRYEYKKVEENELILFKILDL
ncbi:hypothetical protein F132_25 [Flavobacterium sp. phage 1/32]|nr:hypothetical protein F132_25 [Flavobacterium sp. phage 1/32]